MRLAPSHPANLSVIDALRPLKSSGLEVLALRDLDDPYIAYFQCGSHPAVVKHVWEVLGKLVGDEDCCCLVWGTPVLVHDKTGVVLAICYGTEYAVRIPVELLSDALAAGCQQVCTWDGVGEATDIREELGPDWVFGCFATNEPELFRSTYERYSV